MGYACPVCAHPQADAEHLANHLAITAIARGGAHERWLDERVERWDSRSAAELAAALADHVEENATPLDASDPPDRPAPADAGEASRQQSGRPSEPALDAATREALATARALTRRQAADAETNGSDGA